MRTLALTLLLLAGSAAAARADVRWTLDLESVRVDSVTLHGVEGPGKLRLLDHQGQERQR